MKKKFEDFQKSEMIEQITEHSELTLRTVIGKKKGQYILLISELI